MPPNRPRGFTLIELLVTIDFVEPALGAGLRSNWSTGDSRDPGFFWRVISAPSVSRQVEDREMCCLKWVRHLAIIATACSLSGAAAQEKQPEGDRALCPTSADCKSLSGTWVRPATAKVPVSVRLGFQAGWEGGPCVLGVSTAMEGKGVRVEDKLVVVLVEIVEKEGKRYLEFTNPASDKVDRVRYRFSGDKLQLESDVVVGTKCKGKLTGDFEKSKSRN